jgi:hypothetical protein
MMKALRCMPSRQLGKVLGKVKAVTEITAL